MISGNQYVRNEIAKRTLSSMVRNVMNECLDYLHRIKVVSHRGDKRQEQHLRLALMLLSFLPAFSFLLAQLLTATDTWCDRCPSLHISLSLSTFRCEGTC